MSLLCDGALILDSFIEYVFINNKGTIFTGGLRVLIYRFGVPLE